MEIENCKSFYINDVFQVLRCEHKFHGQCLKRLVTISNSSNKSNTGKLKCPVCRREQRITLEDFMWINDLTSDAMQTGE